MMILRNHNEILKILNFLGMSTNIFECWNIRISYEYSNAISGFEYSHNFLSCNIVMYQEDKGRKII